MIAAVYTPFDKEGNVNTALIPGYAHYLKRIGVDGVFVNGTTGEGTSLSIDERMEAAVKWSEQQAENFKIMIHVGHSSLPTCCQLAEHASSLQVDAIGAMAPLFFKPSSIEDLVDFNAAIAAAGPELPFYYYHIPSMTGVNFSMVNFLALAAERIPNLAGIKFTQENFMNLKQCLEFAEQKYDILHGRDEILLCAMVLGVKGAIGSTYNYLAPLFKQLINAFNEGRMEEANQLQWKAIRLIKVLIDYGGGVRAGKVIMKLLGLDLGEPRLPLKGLALTQHDQMQEELEALGLYEHSLQYADI